MSDTTTLTACDLCGLDCGRDPYDTQIAGAQKRFCCLGCMNVYAILLESGALKPGMDARDTDLFKRSLELGLVSNNQRPNAPQPVADGPVEEQLFHLSGLWCSACAWLIEHTLSKERGVVSAEVLFFSDVLRVRYQPQLLPASRIVDRVRRLGYGATAQDEGEETGKGDRKDLLLRLGVAAFLWLNVMGLNLAVYIGAFQKLPDSAHRILPMIVMVVTLPVILYSAYPILRLAWLGLVNRSLRMESLLGLGILAAFTYSTIEGLRGGTHIYFDITCAITTLVLLGKWIEQGAKHRAARTIDGLHRMLPRKARILESGRERFVTMEALARGHLFLVKAGERVPADGEVVDGESETDESLLTGESAPVAKLPGRSVIAGSLNLSGPLTVRATTVGASSTIAQIVRAVEHALRTRSEIERKVDAVSRAFIPAVIAIAAAVFGGGVLAGLSIDQAVMRSVTVLVIACPCALGLATPLALTAAVTSASRAGILVRDSGVLEGLRDIDTVILDKTGTVTESSFSVLDAPTRDLSTLASVEAYSEHPLGQSLVEFARTIQTELLPASKIEVLRGLGIRGEVDGRTVIAGSRRLFPAIPPQIDREAQDWQQRGATVAYYSIGGGPVRLVAFGNRIRKEAKTLVSELKARGIRVMVVSGDSELTTAAVAAELDATSYMAATDPEEKAAAVRRLQALGHTVAMVGDGINDAPALAAANLGIAMGSGTDLAMRSAAMVLLNGRLSRVLEAFDLSRHTARVVRQNLFWAFFYNTAGIGLAAAGLLNPIVAAAAMVLSSLTVVGNSYRLATAAER